MARLRDAAAELAYGAEGPKPPHELRERILDAARAERPAPVVPLLRRWLFPATAVAAAAAAVAAIGLGLWANSLRGSPAERVVALEGAVGYVVVRESFATLVVCLQETPRDKTYEAWVIKGKRPRPAGLFPGGCRSRPLVEPVEDGDVVAITLEDAGGSSQPTSRVLATANV